MLSQKVKMNEIIFVSIPTILTNHFIRTIISLVPNESQNKNTLITPNS